MILDRKETKEEYCDRTYWANSGNKVFVFASKTLRDSISGKCCEILTTKQAIAKLSTLK